MPKKKKTAKNRKTQISVVLSLKLLQKVDKLADETNRNRSNFIATVIEQLDDVAK